MIVGVLKTCHRQYTWDRNICIFLFNRTTLQVFVTYLIGALYVHPLWFYKHQQDNRVRSKLFVECQRWWFEWRFWFVPSVQGYLREEHKPDPWRNPIERNHMGLHLENEVARWVLKTPTIIFNNPVQKIVTLPSHIGAWWPDRLDLDLFRLSGKFRDIYRLETDCAVSFLVLSNVFGIDHSMLYNQKWSSKVKCSLCLPKPHGMSI